MPPQGILLHTNDFDHMAQAFPRWDHRFEQLSRGTFQGRLHLADYRDVQLFDVEVNQVIRCRGLRATDSFAFSPVTHANTGAYWRGRQLRPGLVNINGPSEETDHRSTATNYRLLGINVHRDLLERASMGLVGVDHLALIGTRALEISPSQFNALANSWLQCLSSTTSPGEPRMSPDQIGIELASHLVDALAEGRIADPVRLTSSQRLRIVCACEEFARAHPPEQVSILTLCELTGVSARSLHYAFLEVTGLSPKAFLKTLRLNQARRELLTTGYARGRILAIAAKYGFPRTGEFAADFQSLFGSLPSQFARGARSV